MAQKFLIAGLSDSDARIEFEFRNSKLYSFWIK